MLMYMNTLRFSKFTFFDLEQTSHFTTVPSGTQTDCDHTETGFTLIELLVVILIIGLLASIGIPSYAEYRKRASIAATATEMRNIFTAFVAFDSENGTYPDDSHRTLPAGMDTYLNQSLWDNETPIGGYYNWEGPNSYPYAAVSIFNCPATEKDLQTLDRMLDNGDLSSGRFRTGTNGRPSYIIEE